MAKKVLIIEFDQQQGRLLAITLQRNGYQPLLAGSGTAGLEMFFEESPDLVFVNLLMPDVQGADIIKRIRSRSEGANLPIYVISQLSGSSELLFKRLGADGQLSKPINAQEALTLVQKRLGPGDYSGGPKAPRKARTAEKKSPPKERKPDEVIPARGSLRRLPFHQLLARLFRHQENGVLQLEDKLGRVSISFRDGCPVAVDADGFIHRLARDGLITDKEAQAVRRRTAKEGLSALEAVASLNLLSPDQLDQSVREFSYGLLQDLCRSSATRFTWETVEVPGGQPLDPAVAIQLAAKHVFPPDKVINALEANGHIAKPIFLASDPGRLPELGRRPEMQAVVAATQNAISVRDLVSSSDLPREDLLRAAYALRLLKVITFDAGEAWSPPRQEAPAEPPPPKEEPAPAPPPPKEEPEPAPPPKPPAAEPAPEEKAPPPSEPPPAPEPAPPAEEEVEETELTDDQLLRLGKQFLKDKTYSKAQRCFAETIDRRGGDDPRILVLLANAAYNNRFADASDQLFDAVDVLRKALAIDPHFVDARLELSRILVSEGHLNLAKEELREQLATDPDHATLLRELRMLERRERRQE